MSRLSATSIAADVRAGRRSAVEVTADAFDRIEQYDSVQPQTWIWRPQRDAALAMAAAVDARIKAGEDLALAGVPFAIKDNLDVAGWPTTAACPAFSYIPERSAFVVERLVAAGAIPLGKTNLDQFATGLVGARSPYGAPGCVFNRAFVSGGSSSGSAVATAAGLVAFALGSDTAGSGRVPAALNHLVGLKPSKGRWSTTGLTPACRSLDCVTVLTNDLADAILIDDIAACFDPADPYARALPTAPAPQALRVGIPRAAQRQFNDAESASLFAAALTRAEQAGFTLVEIDIAPLLEAAQLLYSGPWVAERTAAIENLLRTNPGAIEPTVRAIVQGGLAVSGVDAFRGLYQLQAYQRVAEAIWRDVDALLMPTTPGIHRIADVKANPVALNANLGLYTNFVNLLDMSALAVPAGFRKDGTGFGVTFMGPTFADVHLRDFAARYLQDFPMADTPPLDLAERTPTVRLAVVGAHLAGMPLHSQLTSRDARFLGAAETAPVYKLYAIANSTPPKPALAHVGAGGAAIALEVYELELAAFGSFTAEVPAPLAIGTVTLSDGSQVKGFVAEPRAMDGAQDITGFGGWRAYLASLQKP